MTPITKVEVRQLRLPAAGRRVSLDDPACNEALDVVTVVLRTGSGLAGLGFAHAPVGGAAMKRLLEDDLAPLVLNQSPLATEQLFRRARSLFRLTGWRGLACRAWSAIDIALWDLKAKLVDLPLFRLLGESRPAAPVYLSGLMGPGQDVAQAIRTAKPLIEQIKGLPYGTLVVASGASCRHQIDHLAPVRTRHMAEVLADALE